MLESFVQALKAVVATAGYFMSLSGAVKAGYKSALKDENKLFQVKKKKNKLHTLICLSDSRLRAAIAICWEGLLGCLWRWRSFSPLRIRGNSCQIIPL